MAIQESIPLWKNSRPGGDLVLVDRSRYIIRPRRLRRVMQVLLVVLVLIILVLMLGRETWLVALGRFLVYRESPHPADAILVLGGGEGERCARAAALYHADYAPLVVASHQEENDACPGTAPDERLESAGVPREAIRRLDNPRTTYEEAVQALALFQELGVRRVLLVTDNYHSRRARTIFRDVFAGTGIAVTSVPSEPDWFNLDAWWQDEESSLAVFQEYGKFAWFVLRQQGRAPALEE